MCLQVLLDWCVSEPVLQRHLGGYRAITNTLALIRDVQLINCVLLSWRVWGRADTRVWHVGLQALVALVRGDHPHRGFNVQQMQNVQLVHKITMIFLVSHIQTLSDCYKLNEYLVVVKLCVKFVVVIIICEVLS